MPWCPMIPLPLSFSCIPDTGSIFLFELKDVLLTDTCFTDWVCTSKNTGWNTESYNVNYLDRHDIACGANEVIKRFQLRRNYKGKFMYDYKCCSPNVAATAENKETVAVSNGGGDFRKLDGLNVDCGSGLISRLKLTRPGKNT